MRDGNYCVFLFHVKNELVLYVKIVNVNHVFLKLLGFICVGFSHNGY